MVFKSESTGREIQGEHVPRYSMTNTGSHMMVHSCAMAGSHGACGEDTRDNNNAKNLDSKIEGREAGSPAKREKAEVARFDGMVWWWIGSSIELSLGVLSESSGRRE